MDPRDIAPSFRFAATLPHAREVGLVGRANLAYWGERLGAEGLSPADCDGGARVLVTALESTFLGLRFRECVVAIQARRDRAGARQDGFYFAAGWNSSRPFAAVERDLFSTPYRWGRIRVGAGAPASLGLEDEGGSLAAGMGADAATTRRPGRVVAAGWDGPVFLPADGSGGRRRGGRRWFYARVRGEAQVFPFVANEDWIRIDARGGAPVLRWLSESGFAGTEWVIRGDARHARTRTFLGEPSAIPFSA